MNTIPRVAVPPAPTGVASAAISSIDESPPAHISKDSASGEFFLLFSISFHAFGLAALLNYLMFSC
jgi:hypothetical protein